MENSKKCLDGLHVYHGIEQYVNGDKCFKCEKCGAIIVQTSNGFVKLEVLQK